MSLRSSRTPIPHPVGPQRCKDLSSWKRRLGTSCIALGRGLGWDPLGSESVAGDLLCMIFNAYPPRFIHCQPRSKDPKHVVEPVFIQGTLFRMRFSCKKKGVACIMFYFCKTQVYKTGHSMQPYGPYGWPKVKSWTWLIRQWNLWIMSFHQVWTRTRWGT